MPVRMPSADVLATAALPCAYCPAVPSIGSYEIHPAPSHAITRALGGS